jgi:3-oxoacyl-[acyl-carrier protein] reductase
MYPELAGKIAVVTGGSKGIGADTAHVLVANGVRVAVVARGAESIDRTVSDLQAAGGEAIGVSIDCTSLPQLEELRARVESRWGAPDILIPFAGGFGPFTPIQQITEDEWRSIIDSNLTTTFLTVKTFLPGMIERRRGVIVTMASNAARVLDIPLTASYAAAKAGIAMFSRHAAKELGQYGIRVNCIAPATTLSERVARNMPVERQESIAAMAPLGRLGTPRDSALATLFLVSDSAQWLTGITLDVAGGRVMI